MLMKLGFWEGSALLVNYTLSRNFLDNTLRVRVIQKTLSNANSSNALLGSNSYIKEHVTNFP